MNITITSNNNIATSVEQATHTESPNSIDPHSMSLLPKESFVLTGGCYCQAIRYTVSVPQASERPLRESDEHAVIGDPKKTNNALPRVEIDHCSMCRRIQGSVVLVWVMALRSWVEFSLSQKSSLDPTPSGIPKDRLAPPIMDVLNGTPDILEKTYVSKFSSSEDVTRIFCSACGTNLTFRHNKPEKDTPEDKQTVDFTFGSLDPEYQEWECLKPVEKAYEEFGIGWVKRMLQEGEQVLFQEQTWEQYVYTGSTEWRMCEILSWNVTFARWPMLTSCEDSTKKQWLLPNVLRHMKIKPSVDKLLLSLSVSAPIQGTQWPVWDFSFSCSPGLSYRKGGHLLTSPDTSTTHVPHIVFLTEEATNSLSGYNSNHAFNAWWSKVCRLTIKLLAWWGLMTIMSKYMYSECPATFHFTTFYSFIISFSAAQLIQFFHLGLFNLVTYIMLRRCPRTAATTTPPISDDFLIHDWKVIWRRRRTLKTLGLHQLGIRGWKQSCKVQDLKIFRSVGQIHQRFMGRIHSISDGVLRWWYGM